MPVADSASAAFARAFERGEVAARDFHHVDHVRLACVYLAEGPSLAEATARMQSALRQFAAAAGAGAKYSDVLTARWMARIAAARAAAPGGDVDDVLRACPQLLDKDSVDGR